MQDRYEIRDEEDYSSRVIKPWQLLLRVSGLWNTNQVVDTEVFSTQPLTRSHFLL